MISKSFDFQCEFDFQITTSKMILILNNLYLGYLILILKSSTYDDFAHLYRYGIQQYNRWNLSLFTPLTEEILTLICLF